MKSRNDFCKAFNPANFSNFRFLPIDFIFGWNDLNIIGITKYGARALIRVKNIPIFVDILPKKEDEFIEYNYEPIEYISGREFGPAKTYKRIYFENIKARKDFIIKYANYDMTNNDEKYELLFYRLSPMNTAGWNKVENYRVIGTTQKLPIQVEASYDNIIGIEIDEKETDFLYDKTIVCSWDLETYTPDIYGGIPSAYVKEDKIKMCAMVFRFYNKKEDLYNVLIVDKSLSDIDINLPTWYIIRTDNIPIAMATVLSEMQPDFITGFNDGFYDWPFLKERTYDKNAFLDLVMPYPIKNGFQKAQFGEYKIDGFPRAPTIKIDAENTVRFNGYRYPGCICFDISYFLRKINKTETNWQLNTFLKKYGLASKYDMPYDKMSRIFYLYELTNKTKALQLSDVPFADDKKSGGISINKLTRDEIIEHLNCINDVGIYCMRDASACLDLIYKLNMIPDIRETCNKSNTSTIFGIYNADGMKVRNMIYTYAMKPEWGCWEKKYPIAFNCYIPFVYDTGDSKKDKKKYPGGYVVQPKRGIYNSTMLEQKYRASYDKLNPQSENYMFKGKNPIDIYNELAKENIFSHRPCTGEDFASLYPSLIMCYNFSPEYYSNILPEGADPKKWLKIKTHYKIDDEPKSNNNKYEGYFLQQDTYVENGEEKFKNHGIFPVILRKLFAERKKVKTDMHKWGVILERHSRDISKYLETQEITIELIEKIIAEKINDIAEKMKDFIGKKRELEESKIKNYKDSFEIIKNEWRTTYGDLIAQAQFKYNYYNAKQGAIKVFMNTFYGETGNPKSPFFIVCMSGGITKMGRHSLKSIKNYVESRGYTVLYGDTDSIYPICPQKIFYDLDIKYLSGKCNKEEYFEEMVGITMNDLKTLSGDIARFFKERTGNSFLRMEYEEVLFPYGLMGKKNYFGVAHMTSIDFSLCKKPKLEFFDKNIFARGIATRRRDGSKFAKRELNHILIKFCDFEETDSAENIINKHLIYLIEDTFKNSSAYLDLLYKNYSFRKPNENSHTAQMKFRERMIKYVKLAEDYKGDPNSPFMYCEFEAPNYGDRCNLIITRKPEAINDRGGKDKSNIGDLLEYPKFIGNKYYAQIIKAEYKERGIEVDFNDIEIDFSYYFKELYGKLSRFLLYLSEYSNLLEEKTKEYGEKHFIKQAIKKAEHYVLSKIKGDLIKKYANHFPSIKCDSSYIKEKFKSIRQEFESITGKSKFISLIIKFLTESYELKKLLADIDKLYNAVPMHKIIIDRNLLFKSRKKYTDDIEKRKEILRKDISALCNNMNKKIKIEYAHDLYKLNQEFLDIKACVYLELLITQAQSDSRGDISSMYKEKIIETKSDKIKNILGFLDF